MQNEFIFVAAVLFFLDALFLAALFCCHHFSFLSPLYLFLAALVFCCCFMFLLPLNWREKNKAGTVK